MTSTATVDRDRRPRPSTATVDRGGWRRDGEGGHF